jgi:polar amino acid transport system substrate-binding protein
MNDRRRGQPTTIAVVVAVAVLVFVTGCGSALPADPDDTLQRIRGGTLRAGASINPPWTELAADGDLSGREVDLVEEFAGHLGAEVTWVVAGEEQLVTRLEHNALDLVVGGLTADTPWADKVAVTRPYVKIVDSAGEPTELVMAAPMGENAYLAALDAFLHEKTVQP